MRYFYALLHIRQKISAVISNVVRNLKPLKPNISSVAKIPHYVRNDSKTTDNLFNGFLSRTKVLILLFITAWNAFAEPTNERWIEQEAKTKDFRFRVKFAYGEPELLRIINRNSGKVVQNIPIDILEPSKSPIDDVVKTVDANFDSYPDLFIWSSYGGAGPNSTENYYLYDRKTKKFKFHAKLSSLTQVSINPGNKTIASQVRTGPSTSSETYRFIAGRLTLVGNQREYYDAKRDMEIKVIGQLRKGKMRYTETPVPDEN